MMGPMNEADDDERNKKKERRTWKRIIRTSIIRRM
jgi:hypothetical protein